MGGNGAVTAQDSIGIGHCTTATPSDLCFVYDTHNTLTAVSISGPGVIGSPGDDITQNLGAGVFTVTMTVDGVTANFSFEIIDVGLND